MVYLLIKSKQKIMGPNWIIIAATALIPMVLGMVWYHESLFGTAWLKENNMTKDDMKANQKPLKFFLGFVCNFLLAIGLFLFTVHESSVLGLVGGDPEILKSGSAAAFMKDYAGKFNYFGHGVVHGIIAAIGFGIPFIGHKCLWSGMSFKGFLLDWAFWLICMILMAGVIAQWGAVSMV